MRVLLIAKFVFLLSFTTSYSQNFDFLEERISDASDWQEEVEICLAAIDTFIWVGAETEKSKEYLDKVIENCEKYDCLEQELIAKAYFSEVEINQGNYATIENEILPIIEKNEPLSPKTKALLCEMAGYYQVINGNSEEAIAHLSVAQDILEKQFPKDKRLGKIYYYLGFAHNISSVNSESTAYLKKALAQFTMHKDSAHIIEAKSGLSTLYATDGNYSEAITLLVEAIDLANASNTPEQDKFSLYEALIDVYIRNGNYKKAEKNYKEVIPKVYAIDLPVEEKAINLWSLHMQYAKLLGRLNLYKEGLQYVDSSYVYANYLNEFTVRITDLRKGGLLVKTGNYELAESHLKSLFENMKTFGNPDAVNSVLVGLFSTIYTNSNLQPNRKLIEDLLPVVDRIIEKNKDQYNLDVLDAEQLSAMLGLYTFDEDRSMRSFSRVVQIKDSLHNTEQAKITNELMVQYETNEKEKRIKIQELELSQKIAERNSLIGIALGALLLLGVLFLFYFQKKNHVTYLEEEVNRRTAELLKSNEELEQSRVELERYAYIASHDLKEPLRNVVSFVDLIKRKKLVEDEKALSYFSYIAKGTHQMNKIVQDLVDFSKLRNIKIKFQSFKVASVIDEIENKISSDFNSGSIQTINLPDAIVSDKKILHLVFENLIENGLKFNESNEPLIRIEYFQLENRHVFEVRDNGIGIEREYHEQVFELFKRLNDRSKYGGSGVGLAICKKMLKQVGGDISIEGNLYGGTTFIIELPDNPEAKTPTFKKDKLLH